jgi:hypothetical protein
LNLPGVGSTELSSTIRRQKLCLLSLERLSRHLPATLGAAATLPNTLVHALQPLAILGAFFADFGTLTAGVLVMVGPDQHKMSGRAADFSARHREAKVLRLDVLPAGLEAVVHG